MKIIIFNNLYFPYNKGGAEQYIFKQIEELKKNNNQVIVVCTKVLAFKKLKCKNQIYYLNSLYYNLNKYPKFFRLFWHLKQLLIPTKIRTIKKILMKEKPDLAISHNLLGLSWQIPKLLNKLKIRHIHTLHDIQLLHPSGLMYYNQESIINNPFSQLYQLFTKYYFKNLQEIVSPSLWLLKLHQKQGFFLNTKNTIKSINKKDYPEIIWPKKIEKIIFVGQLEKHKGINFLIEYFKNKSEPTLSVVGTGSLKLKIKNSHYINYLGVLTKENLLKEIKKHDCLIVPSICYENIPMVILEAASVKVPTIATKIGGLVELKDILNLKLFAPNDFKSLDKIIENDAVSYPPEERK